MEKRKKSGVNGRETAYLKVSVAGSRGGWHGRYRGDGLEDADDDDSSVTSETTPMSTWSSSQSSSGVAPHELTDGEMEMKKSADAQQTDLSQVMAAASITPWRQTSTSLSLHRQPSYYPDSEDTPPNTSTRSQTSDQATSVTHSSGHRTAKKKTLSLHRKEVNRRSARASRLRKKDYLDKLEEAARQSAIYRHIAENASDMLTLHNLDAGASYAYVSPSVTKMLGFEAQEMIGKPCYEFIHPDDIGPIISAHESCIAKGEILVAKYRLRRKDGSYLWVETSSRTTSGGIVCVTRDVSHMPVPDF